MVWLLRLLGPSAGLYLGGAAIIGAVGLYGAHWWQIRGRDNQIEKLTVALAIEKGATAELKIGIGEVSANRDQLESRIREQNRAIELLQARAGEADARARNAGLLALRKGQEAAADLRIPTTRVQPGHEPMNQWMRERFRMTP